MCEINKAWEIFKVLPPHGLLVKDEGGENVDIRAIEEDMISQGYPLQELDPKTGQPVSYYGDDARTRSLHPA